MKRILSLLLIGILVFTTVACSDKTAEETTAVTTMGTEPVDPVPTTEAPEPFVTTTILKDGASDFQIVHDGNRDAKQLASRVRTLIRDNFGADLPVATSDSQAATHEIIIGNARPIAEKTAKKLRGELDFALKVEENALVLYAVDSLSYSYLSLYLEQEMGLQEP